MSPRGASLLLFTTTLTLVLGLSALVVDATLEAMTLSDVTEDPTIVIPHAARAMFGQPLALPEKISSPYGPRWKYSDDRYDFHPGIDFYDANNVDIFSIGDGVVYRVYQEGISTSFTGGGNVVSIRHTLPEPILFHGKNITLLYSLYLHLNEFASGIEEDAVVTKGQKIGTMGQSGDTVFTHLHFETRLGTQCSLPFQVSNPSSSCAEWQFEPKINPFFFIPRFDNSSLGTSNISTALSTLQVSREVSTKKIQFYVADRSMLQLNRIKWGSIDLDFSLYTGFNATDLSILDAFNQNLAWGGLYPGQFLSTSNTYNYTFVFNNAAVLDGPISFFDVWGHGVTATAAAGSSGGGGATTTTTATNAGGSDPATTTTAATAAGGTTTPSPPAGGSPATTTAINGGESSSGDATSPTFGELKCVQFCDAGASNQSPGRTIFVTVASLAVLAEVFHR